jgi:hypothetical protein
MIAIPIYLAVAQWVLLVALGILVVVMFRQLGGLLNGTVKAAELGPAVGSQASPLSYARLGDGEPGGGEPGDGEPGDGEHGRRRLTPGDGQPALVAFVDPTCPSCEQLVLTLDELLAADELAALRVLLLISDPASYLQISPAFSATALEIGRPADPADLPTYQVSGTPLLVAIDGNGTVMAAGSVVRKDEVRGYIGACTGQGLTGREAVKVAVTVKGENAI